METVLLAFSPTFHCQPLQILALDMIGDDTLGWDNFEELRVFLKEIFPFHRICRDRNLHFVMVYETRAGESDDSELQILPVMFAIVRPECMNNFMASLELFDYGTLFVLGL